MRERLVRERPIFIKKNQDSLGKDSLGKRLLITVPIVYNSNPLAAAAGARSPRGPLPRGRCRGGPLAAGAACRGLSGAVVEAAAAAAAMDSSSGGQHGLRSTCHRST